MIAMCRRIGNFTEESGLGRLLIYVDLFGPVTLHSILDRKHLKRCTSTILIVHSALYDKHFDYFMSNEPFLGTSVKVLVKNTVEWITKDSKNIPSTHQIFSAALKKLYFSRILGI